MFRKILNLFNRYATRHAEIVKPGFPIFDGAGVRLGNVDVVAVRDGRLHVEGWAHSDQVGLTSGNRTVECEPNLERHDAPVHADAARFQRSGFLLDLPFEPTSTTFWAEIDGNRHVFPLPSVLARELRFRQRSQAIPFLRDAVRAMPHGFHWLLYRDRVSADGVLTALGLNSAFRPGGLDANLFSDDVAAENTRVDLKRTRVTIILPVFNAFCLLPEVLRRVLEHSDLSWRLIIVEDCSSDSRVRPWLREWKDGLGRDVAAEVSIIENETNLGFIGSVNRAIDVAMPFGDHVVLLNSDACPPAGWISRLVRPIVEQPAVASVTPMSNDAEIFSVPVVCEREDLRPGEADAIDRVAARFSSGAVQAEAPTGVGFCMAMNMDFLRRLPEFDTGFGRGYGEEVDWCQRARRLGGLNVGIGNLFVQHRGGASFGQAEKKRLVRKNHEKIVRRYPRYDAEVQDFVRNDPLVTARLALALAWVGGRQHGTLPVYLAHSIGGGAELYLENRLKQDREGEGAVVLRVGGPSRWQVEVHGKHGSTRGETESTELVRQLLDLLPARRIIYSCAVGDRDPISLPATLLSFASGPDDEIDVLIHDFLPLSPSYTLLDSDGVYRGPPDPDTSTDSAHRAVRPDGTVATLSEWRAEWRALLERADVVTTFSQNSRTLVARAFPEVTHKLAVMPHDPIAEIAPIRSVPRTDDIPTVGVLGNIGYHKGVALLRDLSRLLSRNGRARLVVIGNIDPAYSLAAPAIVHGDYLVRDIPVLVDRYRIGRWLIPSIWPETFSYTTHEALMTGLPVFSFDLGAQGDAVAAAAARSGQGGTIPLGTADAELEAMLDIILK